MNWQSTRYLKERKLLQNLLALLALMVVVELKALVQDFNSPSVWLVIFLFIFLLIKKFKVRTWLKAKTRFRVGKGAPVYLAAVLVR